jgi:hypothetical protein
MTFAQYYARTAATLSDEALAKELHCARQLAMQCTRTRRDLALLRVRCLDQELARRNAAREQGPGGAWHEERVQPSSAHS